jgi:hypothetical protein
MSSIDSILLEASALSPVERYELAMAILETLREPLGAPKAKRSRKAAASADGEPKAKREPNAWDKLRAQVSATIKGVDGFKQQHVMKFASFIQPKIKADPEMTSEKMLADYTKWLATDASSVSSGGSKASKSSKASKPELTDDEKAAKRKAAAEKRKATIAAKKAAEALAAAAAPAPKADSDDEDEDEELEDADAVVMSSWEHDFGDGAKMFARYEKDGKVYLYETDGETYLGELKGKKKLKIDPSTPNPL